MYTLITLIIALSVERQREAIGNTAVKNLKKKKPLTNDKFQRFTILIGNIVQVCLSLCLKTDY